MPEVQIMRKTILFTVVGLLLFGEVFAQTRTTTTSKAKRIKTQTSEKPLEQILPGAYQIDEYMPMIKGKRLGIFANNTATVNKTHLVDTLQKLGVTITKIFGPEH